MSTPRQPGIAADIPATIELFAGRGFEFAVEDLASWQFLWVVFWFHLNDGWRPKVLPPRSHRRRGVFATRSPHRPNPIGLSAVELVAVEGLVLRIRGADFVDGTPVLDLKPYVPYTDSIPNAQTGWLDESRHDSEQPATTPQDREFKSTGPAPSVSTDTVEFGPNQVQPTPPMRGNDPLERHEVVFSEIAKTQISWLRDRGTDLEMPLVSVLQLGAKPHPYRRIRPEPGGFQIAMHDWRAHFTVAGHQVHIANITSGYRARQLALENGPELDTHRDFVRVFGPR